MLLLYRGENFDANFYYHTGIDIDHAFFIATKSKRFLFVPALNERTAKSKFVGDVVVYRNSLETLKPYISGKIVFVDYSSVNARFIEKIKKICKPKDVSVELLKARIVKKSDEVTKIKKAVAHTKKVFDMLDLKVAKTEIDVKKQILIATAEFGLEPAFNPIVSTGRNTVYPHHISGNAKLKSIVLVDYGVRYQHYCSDITRCFILDGDKKKKTQYEQLQNICHSIVDELPDLKTGKKVAVSAKSMMQTAGFPDMPHAIGHGVGLDIHEMPKLNFKSNHKLTNAVIAIEPSFYLAKYGMRFEETIFCNGKKAQIL
ncbi:M24 family metallopeptidase [Candidatus Micrarchaeota archaeon]|nr:M24 family metallopeptidase [Candidatus Micrarchaeota archaeon]MBU1165430.1 M24 family metallopeptidase [Candidatus Micrarchaeota archaeon]MBU1886977.1 M24 family metallopeptidase [Candidatus Micrarchaeota archaeon]